MSVTLVILLIVSTPIVSSQMVFYKTSLTDSLLASQREMSSLQEKVSAFQAKVSALQVFNSNLGQYLKECNRRHTSDLSEISKLTITQSRATEELSSCLGRETVLKNRKYELMEERKEFQKVLNEERRINSELRAQLAAALKASEEERSQQDSLKRERDDWHLSFISQQEASVYRQEHQWKSIAAILVVLLFSIPSIINSMPKSSFSRKSEIAKIRKGVDSLADEELRVFKEECEAHFRTRTAELKQQFETNKTLSNTLQISESKISEMTIELQKREEEIATLKAAKEDLETRHEQSKKEADETAATMNERMEHLVWVVKVKEEEEEEMNKIVFALNDKLEYMRLCNDCILKEKNKGTERVATLEAIITGLETRVNEKEESAKNSEEVVANLKKTIEDLKTLNTFLDSGLRGKDHQISTYREYLRELNDERRNEKNAFNKEKNELIAYVNKIHSEKSQFETRVNTLESEKAEMTNEMTTLRADIEEYEEWIGSYDHEERQWS